MVWGRICITEKRSPWEKPWKLPLHERIRPPEKKRAPERPLRRWKWRDQTKKKKKRERERIRIKRNRSRYTWCGKRGSGAWRSHEIEGRREGTRDSKKKKRTREWGRRWKSSDKHFFIIGYFFSGFLLKSPDVCVEQIRADLEFQIRIGSLKFSAPQ